MSCFARQVMGREMDQIILEINTLKDKLHCIQSDYLEILTMSQKAMDNRQKTLDNNNKDTANNNDGTVTDRFSIPLLKHSISISESQSSKSLSRLSLLRQLIVDQSNLSRLMLSAKFHDSSMFKFNVIDMIRNKVTVHSDNRNAGIATREMRTPEQRILVDNHDGHDDHQVQNNYNYNASTIATSSSIRYRGRFDRIGNIDHDHHHNDDHDDGDNGDIGGDVSYTYSFDTQSYEQSDDCDSNFYPDKAFLVNYCNAVAFLLSCYYILITLVPSLHPTSNHSTDAW